MGLRDIEVGAPVRPDTLFPICWVTKSFTATGLALLVDEGKLDWNTPVRETLPEFRLRDLVATEPAAWFENGTAQFATGVEGHIESVVVPLEPAVAPIVFRRLPEPEMAARAFLEPLTGIYRHGTIVFRIGIDEAGRLTFTRNEAATERLLARHGSIFGFADSEFFRIEFRRNAAGEVDALLSHEPTGTYLAERDAPARCAPPRFGAKRHSEPMDFPILHSRGKNPRVFFASPESVTQPTQQ